MRHFFDDIFSPLLWASDFSAVSTAPTSSVSLLVLSSSPSSSFFVKFYEGFEFRTTPSLSFAPSLMPSTTSTAVGSSTKTSSMLVFLSLAPLPSLDRPENILYHFNNSDIVIVDFGMQIPIHPPFVHVFTEKNLLHSPNEQLTSLAGSFGYVIPEVVRNTGHGNPVDIWSTGIIISTRIHKRNTSSLFSLSASIICRIVPSSWLPS